MSANLLWTRVVRWWLELHLALEPYDSHWHKTGWLRFLHQRLSWMFRAGMYFRRLWCISLEMYNMADFFNWAIASESHPCGTCKQFYYAQEWFCKEMQSLVTAVKEGYILHEKDPAFWLMTRPRATNLHIKGKWFWLIQAIRKRFWLRGHDVLMASNVVLQRWINAWSILFYF